MLTSLALIFLVGLAMAALCQQLHLPRIIGMLATGILLGPCVLNVLDGSILSISADLRKLALVIILLKAGLSLDLGDLKKVGRPAILLADEPTANLDSETAADILEIFRAFHQVGVTLIIATHDPQWMAHLSPRILRLEHGHLTGTRGGAA